MAQHLLRGAVPRDAEALSWLREVAGKVASYALAVAADLLGRALALAG